MKAKTKTKDFKKYMSMGRGLLFIEKKNGKWKKYKTFKTMSELFDFVDNTNFIKNLKTKWSFQYKLPENPNIHVCW